MIFFKKFKRDQQNATVVREKINRGDFNRLKYFLSAKKYFSAQSNYKILSCS